MKRFCFIGLGLFAMSLGPTHAQTATDVNEGVRVVAGATTGAQALVWWGRSGRTYFVQQSFDLITWTYLPALSSGANVPDGLNFTCTGDRLFWRLRYTDVSTGSLTAADADFDGDGLSNYDEVYVYHTDPFNRDSDGDGYYDGQEVTQKSNPNSAVSAPNENLADREDLNMNEKPVALFEQTRAVENDWYDKDSVNQCYIIWRDYAGNSDNENYPTGSGPRWSGKLSSLVYPVPQTSPSFNYFNAGTYCQGGAEVREVTKSNVLVGYANIGYRRVGMWSDPFQPGQPWPVFRKYFTYRNTLPSPNDGTVPPVFDNVDMVELLIFQRAQTTALNQCLLLEPTATTGSSLNDYVLSVSAIPTDYGGIALDNTQSEKGRDLWLTLPAGGDGVQVQMLSAQSMVDNISYQAVGGGVQPTVSTPPFANWPYTETYSSETVGSTGALYPAVGDNTGNNVVAAANPLLKFDVKPRKDLYITIKIIGRDTGSGIVSPASLPSEQDLEDYLDSVFVPQVNVHSHVTIDTTQVNVAFDVGLLLTYGANNRGKNDSKMSVLSASCTDEAKLIQSDEEAAIMATAPPDSDASITIYWVACDLIECYSWQDATAEAFGLGDPNQLQITPAMGLADKAMDSDRVVNDTRPRVIWIMGQDGTYFQSHSASQMYCIAHELGHALGNIGHTINKYATASLLNTNPDLAGPWSGYSPNSDNLLRLMTGIAGPKRGTCPALLNKLERDKISLFTNYKTLG